MQVSAPDDFTFVVQLSYKCAYFLTDVCAASATMPVRSDAAEQEDWSLHSETLLTDGPIGPPPGGNGADGPGRRRVL